MAITAWQMPPINSATLTRTVKVLSAVRAGGQILRNPTRVPSSKYVIVPKASGGGGGGASVPSTGQIWPRGTTSKTG